MADFYFRGDIEIVGVTEIHVMIGISRQHLVKIIAGETRDEMFPAPIACLGTTNHWKVWLKDEVEDWIRRNPRMPEHARRKRVNNAG